LLQQAAREIEDVLQALSLFIWRSPPYPPYPVAVLTAVHLEAHATLVTPETMSILRMNEIILMRTQWK
jgi:hypothetical protein